MEDKSLLDLIVVINYVIIIIFLFSLESFEVSKYYRYYSTLLKRFLGGLVCLIGSNDTNRNEESYD